jgi:hypothetical protein
MAFLLLIILVILSPVALVIASRRLISEISSSTALLTSLSLIACGAKSKASNKTFISAVVKAVVISSSVQLYSTISSVTPNSRARETLSTLR